jgi:hypothetical protein
VKFKGLKNHFFIVILVLKLLPWHPEVSPETENRDLALTLMYQFSYSLSPPSESAVYPFWRMLQYSEKSRWTASEALVHFQKLLLGMPQTLTYHSRNQLSDEMKIVLSKCNQKLPIAKKLEKYTHTAIPKKNLNAKVQRRKEATVEKVY